jgi:ERCC4-type nuclease
MIMIIQIDCKERDLESKIKNLIENIPLFKDIQIQVLQLPIGDVILYDEQNEVSKLIIERKSVSDLANSIKDGRYEEQSFRLDGLNHHNHNIIYLIEGDISKLNRFKDSKIDKLTLYSSIISLNYFKGFSVIRTFDLEETALFICNSINKLIKGKGKKAYYDITNQLKMEDKEEINESNCKDYINVVKKVKKENITPENIHEIMLCQIPGISNTTALALIKEFNSITNLLNRLKEDKDCCKKITYINTKGQERKINKSTGDTIMKFLL